MGSGRLLEGAPSKIIQINRRLGTCSFSGDFSISIAEITKAMINNESPQNLSTGFSFFAIGLY